MVKRVSLRYCSIGGIIMQKAQTKNGNWNWMALASMVLGVIAIALAPVELLSVSSIPLGAVSIIMGVLSLIFRANVRTMSITGLVLSVIAIVISIVLQVQTNSANKAAEERIDDAVKEVEDFFGSLNDAIGSDSYYDEDDDEEEGTGKF